MVEDTLKRFQLDFEKHIVATTSDGPNVMKKFGRESPSEMILCLNHAIHLGVVDTFYKKRQATSAVSSSEDTDDSDDEIMENKNSSDDEADDNASYDTNFRLQPIDEIKRVLDETRSLVKLFRKSPLKNWERTQFTTGCQNKVEFHHCDGRTVSEAQKLREESFD
ncbi:hypothetical protein PYW07_012635 [Mythimna separata]|uniref:Uncharacterized protein n=1 Tax=Mythimna separata TaxID=271217 RepID=A0AAD7Y8J6_MYTSE|nr:hypothetical protein PYW07_012635 [Mythimna separata]